MDALDALIEKKLPKLEPIKKMLEEKTNYYLEPFLDGYLIVFPYRFWSDGDGISVCLMLDDDMETVYLQDDDLCIHCISLCDTRENTEKILRPIASRIPLTYRYEGNFPVFYKSLGRLSHINNLFKDRPNNYVICGIEEFVRGLIILNFLVDEENITKKS